MNIVKASLSRYHQIQLEWGQIIVSECDNMRQAFDQINPDYEIRTFISDVKSGENPPPVEPYEPYLIDDVRRQSLSVSTPKSVVNTDRSSVSVNSPSLASSSPVVTSPMMTPSSPQHVVSSPSSTREYVKASYEYQAQSSGELQFNEGEVIEVLEKNPDGWWVGVLNGNQGLFPSNFVEPFTTEETDPVPSVASAPPPPFNPPPAVQDETIGHCRALYDYDAQDPEELSFKEGALISVYQKVSFFL